MSIFAVDTSIVVPALIQGHEHHNVARAVMATFPRIPAHVAIESYAVLTRMPASYRLSASDAGTLIADICRDPVLTLPAEAYRDLLAEMSVAGITGGATYDAVIAGTVRSAGGRLLTLDRRAEPVYRQLGLEFANPG
ncbi:MAG TPA: PIN domain-containing protein [Acidimicrobiales bacterium]|nr:PIN domain-containing protein [Acidimicrobiales bacterium]